MKRCSKCNVEKTDDQYQTYFHSTQNKQRTRRVCNTCFNEQKRLYRESIRNKKIIQPVSQEPPTIDYSNNPDYCLCKLCQEYVHNDGWYWSKRSKNKSKLTRSAYCKKCSNEKYGKEYKQKLREKGGSEYVYAKPGIFGCEIQKETVFEVMRNLGYIYNEEHNVWLKPDVKELIDGKIVFPNLKKYKRRRDLLTEDEKEKIHQLYREGISYGKIAKILGKADSTIYKRLKAYEPTFSKKGN